jgi:plasmid stabilization system protein ParE
VRVRWTELARGRLTTVELIDTTKQLADNPLSGSLLPEDGAYRQLVVGEYRIVYRVADRFVYVMTIVAPGMLFEQSL